MAVQERPASVQVAAHERPQTPTTPTGSPLSPQEANESPKTPAGINFEEQPQVSRIAMGSNDEEEIDEDMPAMTKKSTMEEKAPWRESHRRQANHFRAKALHYIELENMTSQKEDMTRRDIFRDIVTKQRKYRHGCLVLPLNIAFFVLYASAVVFHEDITNVWLLESAMRHRLGADLQNVNTIGDVWTWLKGDMVDLFFEQKSFYGEPLPESEWSRVLLYSQVQGSVILEQKRANGASWGIQYPGQLDSFLQPVAAANTGFVSKAASSRRLAMMKTQWMSKFLNGDVSDNQKYEFPLYPTVKKELVVQNLDYLRERRWLDEHTQTLSVTVIVLNGELGRPRLEQCKIELQFSRGGGIYAKVSLQALFLELFGSGSEGLMSMGVDLLWTVMLTVNTGICIRQLWSAFVATQLRKHLTSGVAMMELFIMFLGWLNIGGLYLQATGSGKVVESLDDLRTAVAGVNTTNSTSSHLLSQDEEIYSARLHEDAKTLIYVMEQSRTGLAWMTLVLILRFFTSFRVQPRLAVVTNTLKATIIDLAHFLIVFTPTFFAYAISGNILFGRRIVQFSTLQGAVGICLRIAFENEFEWWELSEEYYYSTAVWAWSFLVIVVMIMLNMVLAIVLDIYNEVRATTDSSETIFRFMWQAALNIRYLRQWIADRDLECFFDDNNDDSAGLTTADISEALPTITDAQRSVILDACKSEMFWQAKQELVASHFLKLGASVKLSVDDATHNLTDYDRNFISAWATEQDPDSRMPETPRSGGTLRTPPTSPKASPRRMVGVSKPFPGIAPTPGGYCPPVCPPRSEDISVSPLITSRAVKEGEPKWYNEFWEKMKSSGEVMDVVLSDLRTLHWQWHQIDVSANRKVYGEPKARKSVCSLSDLKIAGGHPIL